MIVLGEKYCFTEDETASRVGFRCAHDQLTTNKQWADVFVQCACFYLINSS